MSSGTYQYTVGEIVVVNATMRRKWWQFWKPREWIGQKKYVVTAVGPACVMTEPVE